MNFTEKKSISKYKFYIWDFFLMGSICISKKLKFGMKTRKKSSFPLFRYKKLCVKLCKTNTERERERERSNTKPNSTLHVL